MIPNMITSSLIVEGDPNGEWSIADEPLVYRCVDLFENLSRQIDPNACARIEKVYHEDEPDGHNGLLTCFFWRVTCRHSVTCGGCGCGAIYVLLDRECKCADFLKYYIARTIPHQKLIRPSDHQGFASLPYSGTDLFSDTRRPA